MTQHPGVAPRARGLTRRPRDGWVGVLLLLAGCQIPAADVATDDGVLCGSRPAVLAQQVAEDSVVSVAHRPLRSGWVLLYEVADEIFSLGHGELGKRLVLPLCGAPGPLPADGPDAVRFSGCQPVGGLEPTGVRLQLDGQEALAALLGVVDSARSCLDVLMFEWEDDEVGGAVAARLLARADAGVRVRVLVDGGGNLIFGRPFCGTAGCVNAAVARLVRHPNVEVRRTRNPFGRFDHRKLVLADGREAWSGGRNLVRRSFFEQHDLSYTFDGPLVAELDRRFETFWLEQGGPARLPRPDCPDLDGPTAPGANAWARLVHTEPGDHQLQYALYRAVDRARHHVYLENVYFNDGRLLCKLARARWRGVDVRVVLTVSSTNPAINRANRVVANRLHRAGVRVYLYPGMTHVKAATADGCWAYLGTGNFDPLSLRRNREIGLVVGAGPLIGELEGGLFQADFQPEWEMTEPLPVSFGDYACELIAGLWL